MSPRENIVVHAVRIESPRGDVAPVFLGQTPAEAAAMAGLLFSLCPAAQSLAVEAAGEAALNHTPDPARSHARALRVLCERFGEMLRASVLDWPRDAPPAREEIDALRVSLNVLRAMPDRRRDRAFAGFGRTGGAKTGAARFFAGRHAVRKAVGGGPRR